MKKKDIKVLMLLSIIFAVLVLIYTGTNNIYGSMTDWVMQHTVLPDYFRTLFYHTGDITPNLAANIGAGQNIYYFSYYGLLNPFVLLSYLLPFVKMVDYLIIINILIVIVSAYLVYRWLSNNNFDSKTALISSILFLLINAFFHAHRHIMFIDYMPFLILGLIGIDKYFKENKSYLFTISVFLMIMTSYYYSVGGLLCLLVYGIYRYIETKEKVTVKSFFVDGFKFLIPMFTGIMMSLILLLPTVFAIFSSRSQAKEIIGLGELLMPNFNFEALLYSNYGMGFTVIAVLALLYITLHSEGARRFLSTSLIILITVPVFMYILNGMLYLRGKVFIPMSPLIILIIGMFLEKLKNKEIDIKNYFIILLLTIVTALLFEYSELPFYLDLIITSLSIILYFKHQNLNLLYAPLIIIALCSNLAINKNDTYVTKESYEELNNNVISEMISKVNDNNIYRMNNIAGNTSLTVNKVYDAKYYQTTLYSSTYNPFYKSFYDDEINNAIPHRNKLITSSSNNIIFQTLMGVKYVITTEDNIPIGYKLIEQDKTLGLYQNDFVLPIGYSSSSLMSLNSFDKLSYPYRGEALLNNVVIDKDVKDEYQSSLQKVSLSFDVVSNYPVTKKDQQYIIDTDKEEEITLKLKESLKNKVLFIKFELGKAPNCSEGDIEIAINNVKNKLTCKQWLYFNDNYTFEYVISSPDDIEKLNIVFSKGHFEIDNIETYIMNYDDIKNLVSTIDPFVVDQNKTKGDVIEGNIDVKKDGYFMMSIPYDKGFTVYVDNEETKYEMVNKAFIGFPISSGSHHIKFVYKAPGYDAGRIGSIVGFIFFIIIVVIEKRKGNIQVTTF